MFVVDINSIGEEILFLMVPFANECLVVKLLVGMDAGPSEGLGLRFLVVKALESDIFAECD
jgi:hypothetical protein